MCLERRLSFVRPMPLDTNDATLYTCYGCDKTIDAAAHMYMVQRRRIRPVKYDKQGKPGRHDSVQTWHDGVQVGPEYDPHCDDCFDRLPSIDDLLAKHKGGMEIRVRR